MRQFCFFLTTYLIFFFFFNALAIPTFSYRGSQPAHDSVTTECCSFAVRLKSSGKFWMSFQATIQHFGITRSLLLPKGEQE